MNDIYDIKPLYAGEVSIISLVIFLLGMICILYFLFFFRKKENIKGTEDVVVNEEQIDIKQELYDLQSNYSELSPEVFLNKLDFLIRSFLANKTSNHIMDKSFGEIDNLAIMTQEEKELFFEVYTYKYSKNFDFNKKQLVEKTIDIL